MYASWLRLQHIRSARRQCLHTSSHSAGALNILLGGGGRSSSSIGKSVYVLSTAGVPRRYCRCLECSGNLNHVASPEVPQRSPRGPSDVPWLSFKCHAFVNDIYISGNIVAPVRLCIEKCITSDWYVIYPCITIY